MAGSKWVLRGDFGRACVAVVARTLSEARFAVAAVAVLGCLSPHIALAQSMSLPGSFAVGDAGAATYSVPIAVPPGTGGVSPSLTLSYSSQGANGIVGVGWSLDGLPSIGRCPRTWAQDGFPGGINYDTNDRFCFEGQRLIAISGGYGADGAEYRTEIDSFSRIISHGAAGNGPAWFEVHTKSGQVMEFGRTTDSQILAQGKARPRPGHGQSTRSATPRAAALLSPTPTMRRMVRPIPVASTTPATPRQASRRTIRSNSSMRLGRTSALDIRPPHCPGQRYA
jgi:Salmonella virulence plasmid 65kDa B protein